MTTPGFRLAPNPHVDELRTLIADLKTTDPQTAPSFGEALSLDALAESSGPDSSDALSRGGPAPVVDQLSRRYPVLDRVACALLDQRECNSIKAALRRAGLPSFDQLLAK